jgi:hypothetical protein
MSQALLTPERSFWRIWRGIAYFGLDDQTEERLVPASLGGFSKTKRLLLLTSDSNELQTLAHIRTIQTAIPCDNPGRELLTTKRSTKRMVVMLLSERHLFTHKQDGGLPLLATVPMESQKNCQGDVGQQAALVSDERISPCLGNTYWREE